MAERVVGDAAVLDGEAVQPGREAFEFGAVGAAESDVVQPGRTSANRSAGSVSRCPCRARTVPPVSTKMVWWKPEW